MNSMDEVYLLLEKLIEILNGKDFLKECEETNCTECKLKDECNYLLNLL